jgi:hypothetical protein
MIRVFLPLIGLSFAAFAASAQHWNTAHFVAHELATGLVDGYQIVVADLNRDGRPDLLPVASGLSDLAWYENPTWERHVMTDGLTRPENVDVFDLDGDGIPEVGLASGFSQSPMTSAGVVSILRHQGDPAERWSATEIDRIPTSHRVGWADIDGTGRKVLVNAPLVGANAEAPDFRAETPLVLYRPGGWERELIASTEGLVHGFHLVDWNGRGRDAVVTAGFAGVYVDEYVDGSWHRSRIVVGDSAAWPKGGASEFTVLDQGAQRLFATIEPWHGHQVVVYRMDRGEWTRNVIDTQVSLGHAVVNADLDADGRDELIVADRGSKQSVYLYTARDDQGLSWDKEVLDDTIQASSCAPVDLDGDARLDIVCIGRATENLKWYENTTD